jgi:SAM-dependent methyltransferase
VYVQSNWYTEFFDGLAVDLWLNAVSPEYSRDEAARLRQRLDLPAGADILDVPCGAGRLAIELAAQDYRVTGVDLSPHMLAHARAADAAGRVTWDARDMRDLPWRDRFDGAFCLGNSFGYLDDEGNAQFLAAVARALKPGGRFVLETPMIVESLLPTLQERPWFKAGDVYLLVKNEYDAARGRLDIEYTFLSGGRIEVRHGSHRAYSYRELVELMDRAGFNVAPDPAWTAKQHTLTLVGTRR